MEENRTKQRIMEAALTLFAEKGYAAVRMGELAEAVGIRAPSIYKHFKSKQDLFDAILKEMSDRYRERAGAFSIDGTQAGRDALAFAAMNEEQLIGVGKGLFFYFLHDDYACKFRRMLALGQYANPALSALYAKQYVEEPLSFQGALFGMLAQAGKLLPENPRIMALHFYAPVFLLLTYCDCHPEMEPEAVALLEEHIRQFNRLYRKKEEL